MFSYCVDDPEMSTAESSVDQFYNTFEIQSLLTQSNFEKRCGIAVDCILKFLLTLIFSGKNLYNLLESKAGKHLPFEKDTVYRFLNSCRYNWRTLLLRLASSVISTTLRPLSDEDRKEVLIADTSPYSRNRSKTVELLSRVYDPHNDTYMRGFRMLTLGWSDGISFIPLCVSLLSSSDRSHRYQGARDEVDGRTVGAKRRREAVRKAPAVLADLIRRAATMGIQAPYLLVDSWFSMPQTVIDLWRTGVDVICRLKKTPKVHYRYEDQIFTLKRLYAHLRKRRGRAKILTSVTVRFTSVKPLYRIPVKIVFVRDRTKSRNWLALVSTDTSLSDEEIVRLYGKRWEIEVFFKMAKSYLKLAKEFQGRSYDMLRAYTTIVCIRYIMLALEARQHEDGRTFGHLFYDIFDELRDLTFEGALLRVIELLKDAIRDVFIVTEDEIEKLMEVFFTSLPAWLRQPLADARCES